MSELSLSEKKCTPCSVGTPPLSEQEQLTLLAQVGDGWRIISGHHLERELRFEDFKSALAFVNRVGELAEELGHHPDLVLSFGRVSIRIWTHKIDGLTESDFVLAARIDLLLRA